MNSPPPENFSGDRKKAIDKLIRGREVAHKLKILLSKPHDDELPLTAVDLVVEILRSFNETLSTLNCGDSDVSSQVPAMSSPCWDDRKSEDSGESCKTSALKDRRGCYKRRKTMVTWTTDTPAHVDDGHAWRKYGQKVILNTPHPRSYFRCTHKTDQGCPATKQVQQTEEDPPMFRTTYHGHHKCQNVPKTLDIVLDSTVKDTSSYILDFGSVQQDHEISTVKQEELALPSDHDLPCLAYVDALDQSTPSDYPFAEADLSTFESPGLYSCAQSTRDFDISDFDPEIFLDCWYPNI